MARDKKNILEHFLNLFTPVRAGEGVSAVLLFANLFILLTSYYIIKPVREALILAEGSAELKSYMAAGQAILLVFAVRGYSKLANRFPRKPLITVVTIFFAACLVLFYILGQFAVPLGVVFFLWVGIFNLMIIAQFWAFANDLYVPESGKRLFVIIQFGGSLGAVIGSVLVAGLIEPLGVYLPMLITAGLLLFSLVLTFSVDKREKSHSTKQKQIDEIPLKPDGAFKLVFQKKYLLLIAFMMLLLNWVNTTGEYILSRTVMDAAQQVAATAGADFSAKEFIGKFYAEFFSVVNVASLLIQLLIVSRILKYLGIRIALLILPLIALASYTIIAFYPLLAIVRWTKTAENSTDYSLQNTVRQILFLPTRREEKYKAKQAIDTFFWRAGDVLSALLVFAGTLLAFQTKHFALFNVAIILIWIVLAVMIGRENKRMSKEAHE